MREFQLDEWEIGPRCQASLEGLGHEEASGVKWRAVEMRPQQFVIFVRGDDEQGNWVVRQNEEDRPRIWSPNPPRLKIAFPERGRLFTWGDEMAFVAPSGDGAWLDTRLHVTTPFWGAAQPDLIAESSRETFEFLTRELNGDSDFAFARRWENRTSNGWQLLLGGEENYDFLLQILESVLWEFGDQMKWAESNWRLTPLAPQGAYVNSLVRGEMKHSPRLERLLLSWSRFFAFDFLPTCTQTVRQQRRCLDEFYNQQRNFIEVGFNGSPTYHERIEAHFRLREWLEHNAPKRMDLLP